MSACLRDWFDAPCLAIDVAPRLADRLARAWVWVDSKVVHAAWLASLGRPR